ncbi:DUF6207 family protein [Streptomyces sp. Ag109_G2-15]|uniref:DUF6207 family protein n=1 Tax=Streptomyces sp. Ag109_G2-15 TaxID=1938850 RepID=UPI00211CAE8E|nr:DUF6207 family protein [Streptomyces sp. Ag109_G2-15]
MEQIHGTHVPEPGVLVIDVSGADGETVFAFQNAVAQVWAIALGAPGRSCVPCARRSAASALLALPAAVVAALRPGKTALAPTRLGDMAVGGRQCAIRGPPSGSAPFAQTPHRRSNAGRCCTHSKSRASHPYHRRTKARCGRNIFPDPLQPPARASTRHRPRRDRCPKTRLPPPS